MDLSILIPSRHEIFLKNTIEDITKNIRGDTEVIAVLDGEWANPPIIDHPRVTLIYHPESIGQRAATNEAARLSQAKYLIKCDSHCSFDEGFDVKLMTDMQDDWTMVPIMRNLHVFDWVCRRCGDKRYQGPTPTSCPKCDNTTDFERDVVWIAKTNPQSTAFCFDPEPHLQYFRGFKRRPEGRGDITETMSLQGSCFMITREKYFELNICDENTFGSWGSQGIEVACKTWLSGGRVICNHKTWYAHLFRTQGGDFGFPYHNSGRQIQCAKQMAKEVFFNNKWPKQIHPISWLIEKFWPVPGWKDEDLIAIGGKVPVAQSVPTPIVTAPQENLTKGIVYYTDNRIDEDLAQMVMDSIIEARLPVVAASLQPIDFFGMNIVLDLERSYLTMFKQVLEGLEALDTDIVFLVEHDVLYSKEHFDFTPIENDRFYYNKNNWQVRQSDGHAVYWDCKKVSQVCGYRDLFLKHYTERVRRVEAEGFTRAMGFEPGSHGRAERVDDVTSEFFETKIPNLDIRHKGNLTSSRWSPDKFRNKPKNWTESHVNKLLGWEDLMPCGNTS